MSARILSSDCWTAPDKEAPAYRIVLPDRQPTVHGSGTPAFELIFPDEASCRRFFRADSYVAALDFINGQFAIRGDLPGAIALKMAHPGTFLARRKAALLALASSWRLETLVQSRRRAKQNIEFHYDRSNAFFRAFLDSRMVYSCAYFHEPGGSLDEAQLAKLDLICRKLDLQPDERFLDIGCGWGGLLLHAAEQYGAAATGYTLSQAQTAYVRELADSRGLAHRLEVYRADFRDITGCFDKIASVGMFEHVGRKRLPGYFRKVHSLLAPEGRFLNHGIIRPEAAKDGPDTRFLRNYVFPGGELAHLSDVIHAAESAGFETLDVESLRPHYAITCRHWVKRLQDAERTCVEAAGEQTYRIWLLYLAASALSFQEGGTDIYQILFAKRSSRIRRLTRSYICQEPRPAQRSLPNSELG